MTVLEQDCFILHLNKTISSFITVTSSTLLGEQSKEAGLLREGGQFKSGLVQNVWAVPASVLECSKPELRAVLLHLSSWSSFNQRSEILRGCRRKPSSLVGFSNQMSLQTDGSVQAKLICIFQEKALDWIVYPAAEDTLLITNKNVKWTKLI